MKKVILVIVILLMLLSMTACGESKVSSNEIPDVFGVQYTSAIELLEAEGFEVTAVAVAVDGFSVKLLYPLEKVDKGIVFKIDDYIIDNNGNLNKNYDVFYADGLISNDKSVVIYYAQEDYVREADVQNSDTPSAEPGTEPATEASTEEVTEQATGATTEEITEGPTMETEKANGLGSDFKEAMDSYEDFMDEYVAFMKKYNENPNDLSLLVDYMAYLADYAEFVEDFAKWGSEDLNDAELAYYLEVQTRVNKKLMEVA